MAGGWPASEHARPGAGTQDDTLPFDLLDAPAVESDPRARLMRERGWDGWIRSTRMPGPPGDHHTRTSPHRGSAG
jgi:hypothetical protein